MVHRFSISKSICEQFYEFRMVKSLHKKKNSFNTTTFIYSVQVTRLQTTNHTLGMESTMSIDTKTFQLVLRFPTLVFSSFINPMTSINY